MSPRVPVPSPRVSPCRQHRAASGHHRLPAPVREGPAAGTGMGMEIGVRMGTRTGLGMQRGMELGMEMGIKMGTRTCPLCPLSTVPTRATWTGRAEPPCTGLVSAGGAPNQAGLGWEVPEGSYGVGGVPVTPKRAVSPPRTDTAPAATSGCASSVLLLCDHEAVLDVTDAVSGDLGDPWDPMGAGGALTAPRIPPARADPADAGGAGQPRCHLRPAPAARRRPQPGRQGAEVSGRGDRGHSG